MPLEDLRGAFDTGQGCLEIVRDMGEKVVAEGQRLLDIAIETGIVDGQRTPVCQLFRQRSIGWFVAAA